MKTICEWKDQSWSQKCSAVDVTQNGYVYIQKALRIWETLINISFFYQRTLNNQEKLQQGKCGQHQTFLNNLFL